MNDAPSPVRRPAVGFIFVTMVLAVLGFGLLIPVLPGLVTEFQHGDVAQGSHSYGGLVGVFALLQFIGSPILGALSDQFGRRRVILISLAGASIDYVIMANAPTLTWLFVGRMISGFTAGVLATANAYVADVTPPERRAHGFGLLGAAFGIGFVIGPLIGGVLGSIDLRLPFWFAAGCAGLNWLYGCFVLPESLPRESRRPFSWARANPVGALLSLKRFPAARALIESYFVIMLAQTLMYSTWVLCVGYRYHWDAKHVGYSLGMAGVVSAVVQASLTRKVTAHLGDARAAILAFGVSIAAQLCYGFATEGWMIFVIIVLGALGGIAGPALQSYITKHVPPTDQGAVQGIFAGVGSLAGIPGPLIGTWSFGWAVTVAEGSTGFVAHVLPGIPFFEGALLFSIALVLAQRSFRRMDRVAAGSQAAHGA